MVETKEGSKNSNGKFAEMYKGIIRKFKLKMINTNKESKYARFKFKIILVIFFYLLKLNCYDAKMKKPFFK